jgi:hypothetical protein
MTTKRRMVISGSEGLISDLRQLYFTISSLIIRRRMDHRELGGGDTSDITVAGSLKSHIEITNNQAPQEFGNSTDLPVISPPQQLDAPRAGNTSVTGNALVGAGFFKELSNWLKNRNSVPAVEPHIAEKLKASAEEHINKAISMAKQGKLEAAKLHADLAESAVRTAADYMSKDDYQDFKKYVHDRLNAL